MRCGVMVVAVLVSFVSASPLFAQSGDGGRAGPPPLMESDLGISAGAALPSWHGGQRSLPFGPGLSSSYITQAALQLPAVQAALSNSVYGGMIRRPDLDIGWSRGGRSTAILAFQYPGVDVRDREPYIIVLSQEDPYRIFTQVMATATATGPDGKPINDAQAPDAAYFCTERSSPSGTVETIQFEIGPNNPVIWSTAYDLKDGVFPSDATLYYMNRASDCWKANMADLMGEMGQGVFWGTVATAKNLELPAMGWGAAVGAAMHAHDWFKNTASHPCP